MTLHRLTPQQTLSLYNEAVEMAKRRVGFHPLLSILAPTIPVRDWGEGHPDEAVSFALDCQQLPNRVLGNSQSPH
jgi:hypothetical protein